MPIHMGFRDKLKAGLGVIKMGVIGINMGGVQTHIAPSDVISAAKGIKNRQRVTTCNSYTDFQNKLDATKFTAAGWTDLQSHMTNIWGFFATNAGLVLHMITHNSDSKRMKRIEVETTTGNVHTVWSDS